MLRYTVLCTVLFFAPLCWADKPVVRVFIGNPPKRVSCEAFHNHVMRACDTWYEPAGIRCRVERDRAKSHIIVRGDIPMWEFHKNPIVYGETWQGQITFPHIPQNTSKPIRININPNITLMKDTFGVRNTLIHEFGHSVGLGHYPNSIMSGDIKTRTLRLTDEDELRIKQLKRFVDNNWR